MCPLAGTSSNSVTNSLSQYEQKVYGQTRGGTGGTEFLKEILEKDEKRASNAERLFHEYSGIDSFPRHVREERMRVRMCVKG
jgi:molybdenum-dependent DNA-binding transcriptional regulator ModE